MTATDVPSRDAVPEPRLDVRVRNRQGQLLVARAAIAYGLDEVGTVIWRAMDGRRDVEEVAGVVVETYGIDLDQAVTDVSELLCLLHEGGIITFRMPQGTGGEQP